MNEWMDRQPAKGINIQRLSLVGLLKLYEPLNIYTTVQGVKYRYFYYEHEQVPLTRG